MADHFDDVRHGPADRDQVAVVTAGQAGLAVPGIAARAGPGQVFLAKLFAMLAVSLVAAMALNVLPGVAFPALSAGRWAFNPSLGRNILAHTAACLAGGYFAFFALVALQGVLLTLLRPGAFRQVTGVLQAILAAGAVSALVLSFSIEPQVTARLVERDAARWVPPVWFLGLRQALAGDPDPAMHALGRVALLGLGAVAALSATTYAASYMRRRTLLAEGMVPGRRRQRWTGPILDWFVPCPPPAGGRLLPLEDICEQQPASHDPDGLCRIRAGPAADQCAGRRQSVRTRMGDDGPFRGRPRGFADLCAARPAPSVLDTRGTRRQLAVPDHGAGRTPGTGCARSIA